MALLKNLARRRKQLLKQGEHFFDYANRDLLDKSTEFGGVIELDEKGDL